VIQTDSTTYHRRFIHFLINSHFIIIILIAYNFVFFFNLSSFYFWLKQIWCCLVFGQIILVSHYLCYFLFTIYVSISTTGFFPSLFLQTIWRAVVCYCNHCFFPSVSIQLFPYDTFRAFSLFVPYPKYTKHIHIILLLLWVILWVMRHKTSTQQQALSVLYYPFSLPLSSILHFNSFKTHSFSLILLYQKTIFIIIFIINSQLIFISFEHICYSFPRPFKRTFAYLTTFIKH